MSVVVIIVACLQLAGGIIIASLGGVVILAGAGAQSELLVTLGVLIIAVALTAGIFNLIAGILTLQRRGLGFGMFVSIATIIVALVIMMVFAIAEASAGIIICLITLILAILYLVGITKARRGA